MFEHYEKLIAVHFALFDTNYSEEAVAEVLAGVYGTTA